MHEHIRIFGRSGLELERLEKLVGILVEYLVRVRYGTFTQQFPHFSVSLQVVGADEHFVARVKIQ